MSQRTLPPHIPVAVRGHVFRLQRIVFRWMPFQCYGWIQSLQIIFSRQYALSCAEGTTAFLILITDLSLPFMAFCAAPPDSTGGAFAYVLRFQCAIFRRMPLSNQPAILLSGGNQNWAVCAMRTTFSPVGTLTDSRLPLVAMLTQPPNTLL